MFISFLFEAKQSEKTFISFCLEAKRKNRKRNENFLKRNKAKIWCNDFALVRSEKLEAKRSEMKRKKFFFRLSVRNACETDHFALKRKNFWSETGAPYPTPGSTPSPSPPRSVNHRPGGWGRRCRPGGGGDGVDRGRKKEEERWSTLVWSQSIYQSKGIVSQLKIRKKSNLVQKYTFLFVATGWWTGLRDFSPLFFYKFKEPR